MSAVIFTTYFSAKQHPQFGDPHLEGITNSGRVLDNDIAYLRKWYYSLLALDIEGRVFYDNLTDEFVSKYTTSKVRFVKVGQSPHSYNDWRFYCYREYLKSNTWDVVFMTDGSDVTVVQDPSKLVADYPTKKIFLCLDSYKLGQFPYLEYHLRFGWDNYMFFMLNANQWDLINMGVVGGTYANITSFLDRICTIRDGIGNASFNADIWTGNYLFRNEYQEDELLIGDPVTSVFKGYQTHRKDVYFVHK